jgi:hypothetical protein
MRLPMLLVGLAFAGTVEIASETLVDGPMARRRSIEKADLVVLYAGEQKGSMETCGCPHRPRGSLARVETVRADETDPTVLVNAGYAFEDPTGFDGKTRADVVAGNAWMARGIEAGRWDALNVGTIDAAGIGGLEREVRDALPLVSASLEGPGIDPWVIVERGGRRVGITGLTADEQTLGDRSAYVRRTDKEATSTVAALAAKADVVILLSWHAADLASAIARKVDVDIIVDANLHREQLPVETVGRAVKVDTFFQTMRLGELRLKLDGGAIVGGVDRQIDLDATLGDDPGLLALQHEARAALDQLQASLYTK